jgi:hypothetical protein
MAECESGGSSTIKQVIPIRKQVRGRERHGWTHVERSQASLWHHPLDREPFYDLLMAQLMA